MRRKLSLLTAAVLSSVVSSSGAIAAGEGFYVGLGAGLAFMDDADVRGHDSAEFPSPIDATGEGERGFAVSGTVGYGFGNGLRVEGDLGYRVNDIEKLTVRDPGSLVVLLPENAPPGAAFALRGQQAVDGDVSVVTFMASLYYDIEVGGWKPYVGGGVGLAHLSIFAENPAGIELVDDDDTVFTYKIGGGVGYDIGTLYGHPVTGSLDYRYFETEDPTFVGSLTGSRIDTEQSGHYVGLGLRFGF